MITPLDTLLDGLKAQVSPKVYSLLEHLKEGNPAIGADILRALKLYDSQYDLNVYWDPDSFVRLLKFSQKKYKPKSSRNISELSYKDLFKGELAAAYVKEDKIFRMQYSDDGNCNDYLISKGNTKKRLDQCLKNFEEFLVQNEVKLKVLNWYKLRSNYFSNYMEYKKNLDEMFVLIKEIFNKNEMFTLRTIDVNNTIAWVTGPDSSLFRSFENIYKEPILLASKAAWASQRIFLKIDGWEGFCRTMNMYYPKDAAEILTSIWKVRWMVNDWDTMMATGKHKNVAKELQKEFSNLIESISNLIHTKELSDNGKAIQNFRTRLISTLNATFQKDKIWFSNFENKLYLFSK